jgi:hypothetical protein
LLLLLLLLFTNGFGTSYTKLLAMNISTLTCIQ